MAELAALTKDLNFHLEQVQDFTPTPMTLATEIYYTGIHPYTGKEIFTATDARHKLEQRMFFFWYDPEYRSQIMHTLHAIGRPDLINKLFGDRPPHRRQTAAQPLQKKHSQPPQKHRKKR